MKFESYTTSDFMRLGEGTDGRGFASMLFGYGATQFQGAAIRAGHQDLHFRRSCRERRPVS